MQTSNFILATIAEIKTKYPFLIEDEKFDCFEDWRDEDFFLVSDGNAYFEGNFCLDLYENEEKKWLAKSLKLAVKKVEGLNIVGVFVSGDFSVSGCIVNVYGEYGSYVFIGGNVNCQSMLLGGGHVKIKGNIVAKEIVMTDYHFGSLRCLGVINSPVFIVDNHDTRFAERKNELFYYNDRDEIDPKNECEYDDETGDEIMSNELRKLLDNPLIETFEEISSELTKGELLLKASNSPAKNDDYWHNRVLSNYEDLKFVPSQYKTKKLCELALNINYNALHYVSKEFITPELCESLVKKNGNAICVIPDKFVTKEICCIATQNGFLLKRIPIRFWSEEMILLVFKNGKYEPDLNDVYSQFITKNLLVEYIKIGGSLRFDKVCEIKEIDKLLILKTVIDSGIQYLDNIFGNHFSKETVEYAFSVYKDQKEWNKYVQKYRQKFEPLGLNEYL
ncbi:bactofilin family protein [Flavobacterium fluviale]|uniref:Polymer-forming cytoskeletal protein n=1 Tax=Flavobacterium fluviale TaxID=2249356 RepID=A0A344LP08_9FLAO|nr:polymer-forming cytoskeletal protein [Flavobacterium fluviale]AXB55650.1 polymer-forming cytoskeletal protein [Flavobacterium fluviale]